MTRQADNSQNSSTLKQALFALKDMRSKLNTIEQAKTEPIAIIGMACRFPGGANSPESYWKLLQNGQDVITETPANRWEMDKFYDSDPDAPGKMYTRWGGYLDQIDQFEPQFFGISPREAVSMDPQQRLLLEVCWEALENAGLAPNKLESSKTGVFVGISSTEYMQRQLDILGFDSIDPYVGTGGMTSIIAGRLSYVLGLHGPSMVIDTACSSSLVTIHQGCESLRLKQADLILAGGVNLILSPMANIFLSRLRAAAFDGRCKTFDAAADGYVRGEGCGMIVLKRLSDAIADGDNVLALIRGSAVNHDGRSSGLTVPNGLAQQMVIRQALADAATVDPHQISYIEAHGTGTSLGDPIEVRALAAVLGKNRSKDRPLMVGSVKTNIGHLESAAGIASVIKVVMSLQNQEIPPHLHLRELNPLVDWNELPIQIPTQRTPWASENGPRLAGVSAFGLSGTNSHLILEEAPTRAVETQSEMERPLHIVNLSAKSEEALKQLGSQYQHYLKEIPADRLADVAFTANAGRNHFAHRLAIVAQSPQQIDEMLSSFVEGQQSGGIAHGTVETAADPKVGYLFTGQGAQYEGMGRELYESEPRFRRIIDKCAAVLEPYLEKPLLTVLYPAEADRSGLLNETQYTQPALFALEYGLAKLWEAWGIKADVVMGHSVGEVVAACVAGVFSLEDGLKLIAERGRLMGALPLEGEMVSVQADEARVKEAIEPYKEEVSIAAINGPQSVVISGKREAVQAIRSVLVEEGVKCRPLTVSHAFHSPQMEPMLEEFRQVAESIRYQKPNIRLVSNVSGQMAGEEVMTAEHWVRHVRETVRYADGVRVLQEQGVEIYLEIGPKPTLLGLAGQSGVGGGGTALLPSLRERQSNWQQLLSSLGQMYVRGVEIDWVGFEGAYERRKLIVPTYPFQRQRFWIEEKGKPDKALRGSDSLRPLIDNLIKSPATQTILTETVMSVENQPYLVDHLVYGTVIAPGASHLATVMSAAELAFGEASCQLQDIIFPQALALVDNETRIVQVSFTALANNGGGAQSRMQVISFDDAGLGTDIETMTHATGTVRVASSVQPAEILLSALQKEFTKAVDVSSYFETDEATENPRPIYFGPAFRWIEAVWTRGQNPENDAEQQREVLARLRRPAVIDNLTGYVLHPGLLDGCFQTAGLIRQMTGQAKELSLPFAVEKVELHRAASGDEWWCHAAQVGEMKWDIRLFDKLGQIIAEAEGFELRAAPKTLTQPVRLRADWLYTRDWQAAPLPQEAEEASLPDCWLVVGEATKWHERLTERLQAEGRPVFSAREAVQEVVSEIAANHQKVGVIYGGAMGQAIEPAEVPEKSVQLCGELLHLTQALVTSSLSVNLWIVTEGSQVIDQKQGFIEKMPTRQTIEGQTSSVAGGTLWGFGRSLAQEQPQLHCICLDLDPTVAVEQQVEGLWLEMETGLGGESLNNQVAYQKETRYVAQLAQWQAPPVVDISQPVRLQMSEYGSFENLSFVPLSRRKPEAGEIEVEVKASGLNFRDILNVLGMLKDYYANVLGISRAKDIGLGFECAGVVTAVGEGVTEFAVGDRVMGMGAAEGTFASYITTPVSQMMIIPERLSYSEAATIPLTFMTAWYGLIELANLQAEERVLIHAAAGGVGQAAVQIAQAVGAEVIGTASPGKWSFLRQQGIKHIMNSRTLDFSDEIRQITEGKGVDVVFNSLNGEFIDHSFAVLGQGGRFVEIGKIGIWSEEDVARHRPDVAYYPYDFGTKMVKNPTLITELWQAMVAYFTSGRLQPLPQTLFPAQQVVAAFRYMQQAKQKGKIVLSFEPPVSMQENDTYLITGGVGALGLEIAQQLVTDGAKQVVLTSRRGVTSDEQRQALAQMAETGAKLEVVAADITDLDAVKSVLARCEELGSLRGIVHAAGVIDDGVLTEQTVERFENVMKPKVNGTWYLHTLTRANELDFFVCFSSAAALLGSPGQSNYAAANAFMDTLMQQRHQAGLAGMSLNWGPWAEVGMAAQLKERLQAQGMAMITPPQGRLFFQHLLQQHIAQVGVLPIKREQPARPQQHQSSQSNLREELVGLSESERQTRLSEYLQTEISAVLGLGANAQIDTRARLFDFGLDSLMAVELKNRIEDHLKISISISSILEGISIAQLGTSILEQLPETLNEIPLKPNDKQDEKSKVSEEDDPNKLEGLLANLDQLSEVQMDVLLTDLLTEDGVG